MALTTTAKNVALNALLSEIQTGAGAAVIRIADITTSPDTTVIEFPLGVPEYTVSNGEMYSTSSIIATCVATASARNCYARLINRDGVDVGRLSLDYEFATWVTSMPDLLLMGISEFTAGYKYEISEHRIGLT